MKKLLFVITLVLSLGLVISGCSQNTAPANKGLTVVKVGASAVPHAEILEFAKPILAKDGVDLQIVEMNDYVKPNIAVAEKELMQTFFNTFLTYQIRS